MDDYIQEIKSKIQENAGSYLNLPKVIIIGNTGSGKTSLLKALGGQCSSATIPFNFSVDPQHRFILCDFMSIIDKDGQKDAIISNIIKYLFEISPNTENKVTILLAEAEVHVMGTRLRCVIENIKKARDMFGKFCNLEARFGIVITKCIDTEIIKEEFYEQLDKLPSSQISDNKVYFDHIFTMPKIDTDDPEPFEDKERIIKFISGEYIDIAPKEPEEPEEPKKSEEPKKAEEPAKTEKKFVICQVCSKPVDEDKAIYISNSPYHQGCVKCMKCNKTFTPENSRVDDFTSIGSGLFLCKQHYDEQFTTTKKDEKLMEAYKEKKKETLVEEVINQSPLKEEDTSKYAPEEVLVTNEMAEKDTIEKKPEVEELIPSVKLNFDKKPDEINYEKLPEVLGEDVAILNVEKKEDAISDIEKKISTIITIALLSADDMMDTKEIEEEHQKYITELKSKLNSTVDNQAIVGNLTEEPKINIPATSKMTEAINKPSINQLQNKVELSDTEVKEIRKKIRENLKKNKTGNENWKYIFSHEDMYNELEKQTRKDIQDNPYEMIITAQTIITSKFFDEYGKIRDEIPQDCRRECFFYHGSKLNNHQKIAKGHFLMPGQDNQIKQTDPGYYGQGIYATDNAYYASMYANNCDALDINQKAYVMSCRSLYNSKRIKDLVDLSMFGKPIDDEIKQNYGVNRAFVGSSIGFQPIKVDDKDKNEIWAYEYVFPNKYQFIPCCSFTIMRKDHYILWKDDNIDNEENSQYSKRLEKSMEVNVYGKKNVDEALDVVRRKKYAAVKLITNAGENYNGRDLIEKAREIVGSNFVCLVFAGRESHMEWISKMENVLFTNDYTDFLEFASLKMNVNEVLRFINEKLRPKYEKNGYKFNINEEQLLKFPKCEENSDYYKNYYAGYVPQQKACLIA